jgi:hypothetical protein
MIRVDGRTFASVLAFIGVLLGAGWVAYGMLGNGDQVFMTIMIVATIVLAGGAAVLMKTKPSSNR